MLAAGYGHLECVQMISECVDDVDRQDQVLDIDSPF